MADPNAERFVNPHQWSIEAFAARQALFRDVYTLLGNDIGTKELNKHIKQCVDDMKSMPFDDVDRAIVTFHKSEAQDRAEGLVDRRGPKNPFRSKKFNKKAYETKEKRVKTADPGMENIPIRGRQIVNIATFSLLLFVFLQELVYSSINYGGAYDAYNSHVGPSGEVLNDLGGLSTNAVRSGQLYRLFWACYMHSGWFHIGMNLLCQIQYLVMYEPDWGFMRVTILFWGSALAGNLMSSTLDPCILSVGSSGSLFGLMGACLPYCIEYWGTLPRPWMIAVMTMIVMLITILMGFNESGTDNYAHMGGGLAGIFLGFMGTANLQKAPSCCKKKTQPGVVGKEVKKNFMIRRLQRMKLFEGCKCGWREWMLRLLGLIGYSTIIACGFLMLLVYPKFQPPGSITYSGMTSCCCCIPPDTGDYSNPMLYWENTEAVQCGACAYTDDDGERYIDVGTKSKPYPAFDLTVADPESVHLRYPCAWTRAPMEYETDWDEWDPSTWNVPAPTTPATTTVGPIRASPPNASPKSASRAVTLASRSALPSPKDVLDNMELSASDISNLETLLKRLELTYSSHTGTK